MQRRMVFLIFGASLAAMALASRADGRCGFNDPCLEDHADCCEYGYCGKGTQFGGQGCHPRFSLYPESCMPIPVCQSKTVTFGTNGNVTLIKEEDYIVLGSGNVDFVINVGEVENTPDGAVLTLKKGKPGTKITSVCALHRGKVTFEIQTAWSVGVITSAVLMGDVGEEVDLEFLGGHLTSVQSNLFHHGEGSNDTHGFLSDTSTSFAKYSLDWSQDKITWGYNKDGQEHRLRTVASKDFHLPQLPMYPQLAIWPGGDSRFQRWAGGAIDWNDARFKTSGEEFRFIVKSVTVECYDAYPSGYAFKYKLDVTAENYIGLQQY